MNDDLDAELEKLRVFIFAFYEILQDLASSAGLTVEELATLWAAQIAVQNHCKQICEDYVGDPIMIHAEITFVEDMVRWN